MRNSTPLDTHQIKVTAFDDYKVYLRRRVIQEERGFQTELARQIGITPSHLNRIIYADINLTDDQCARLCKYLFSSTNETRYFILLVQLSRATLEDTKQFYAALIKNSSTGKE